MGAVREGRGLRWRSVVNLSLYLSVEREGSGGGGGFEKVMWPSRGEKGALPEKTTRALRSIFAWLSMQGNAGTYKDH